MNPIHLCLIFGGPSSEHEVSLTSAASIVKAISPQDLDITLIWINKQGQWYHLANQKILKKAPDTLLSTNILEKAELKPVLLDYCHHQTLLEYNLKKRSFLPWKKPIDVFFPILHGNYGEDGKIQGLLSMTNIPIIGSGILASASGMDKVTMRALFQQAGLPICRYLYFFGEEWRRDSQSWKKKIKEEIGFPCFVKPANSGSSVGINKVKEEALLEAAIVEASEHDDKILIEEQIEGQELECAVLGNSSPQASVVGEIIPVNEFYDYEAKYLSSQKQTHIPAHISPENSKKIQEMAIKAFQVIGCQDFARVDFFLEKKSETIYINEINTIPGFTPISMFPQMCQASGFSYRELILRMVNFAMEKRI